MARIAVIDAGTLDSLPHNGPVITLFTLCNSTHRESDFDIVIVSIVGRLLALAAVRDRTRLVVKAVRSAVYRTNV